MCRANRSGLASFDPQSEVRKTLLRESPAESFHAAQSADGENQWIESLVIPKLGEIKTDRRGLLPLAGVNLGDQPICSTGDRRANFVPRNFCEHRTRCEHTRQRFNRQGRFLDRTGAVSESAPASILVLGGEQPARAGKSGGRPAGPEHKRSFLPRRRACLVPGCFLDLGRTGSPAGYFC